MGYQEVNRKLQTRHKSQTEGPQETQRVFLEGVFGQNFPEAEKLKEGGPWSAGENCWGAGADT